MVPDFFLLIELHSAASVALDRAGKRTARKTGVGFNLLLSRWFCAAGGRIQSAVATSGRVQLSFRVISLFGAPTRVCYPTNCRVPTTIAAHHADQLRNDAAAKLPWAFNLPIGEPSRALAGVRWAGLYRTYTACKGVLSIQMKT